MESCLFPLGAVAFIRACKNEDLIPTFARFHLANSRIADATLKQKCVRHILQAEMKFNQRFFSRTAKYLRRMDAELKQSVFHIVYIRLQSISQEIVKKKMGDPVTNLSKYILTDSEHAALINGLNHMYPLEKLDQPQFMCNMEYFYVRLLNVRTVYRHYEKKSATEVVRHQLTSLQLSAASQLRETANSFRKVAQSELKKIGVEHRKTFSTLRSLAKKKSIIIARPDKGRGVVIMDRADYVQRMNTILDDRSAFTLINHDPTLDNENELTMFLLVLKKEGFISDQEYKLACPNGSRPARIYGLPKLYTKRENYPLRPVMSGTKPVAYGLGKMMANRLNTLRTSPYTIEDKFDFIRKIRKSELVDKTMVSFDVTSLFTKVPLTYTIDLILDKMYPTCSLICKYKQRSRLSVADPAVGDPATATISEFLFFHFSSTKTKKYGLYCLE